MPSRNMNPDQQKSHRLYARAPTQPLDSFNPLESARRG